MRLKGMERGLKKLVIRGMAAVLRAPRTRDRPDWSSRPHRILYLRYDRIGDMILATGIIEAIAASHSTLTVDVLASPANAAVLRGNPFVAQVLTFDKKRPWTWPATIGTLRRRRYDAILDAMVLSPSLTTVLLMWGSGARHRIGVAERGNEFALTLAVPRARRAVHYVDHSAALLSAFGIDPHGPAWSGAVAGGRGETAATPRRRVSGERPAGAGSASGSDEEKSTRMAGRAEGDPASDGDNTGPAAGDRALGPAIDAPVGGWGIWRPRIYLTEGERAGAEREWSTVMAGIEGAGGRPPKWRLVANVSAGERSRYWPEDRFVSVLSGIRARFPDVWPLIIGSPRDTERMQRVGHAAGVPVAPTPTMREMMALVAAADIVFTADTSVTHVASAFGRPAVVMFPRGRGALYGPYGTAGRVVSTPGPTLETLPIAPVMAALEEVTIGLGDRE